MITLEGKITIVTGGAHGIGRAISEAFVEAGAQVVVADIEDAPCGRFVKADVSSAGDVRAAVAAAASINGRIDILCNNAAYLGPAHTALAASDEEWERCFAVTLLGAQHFTREVLPYMMRQRGGSIINISSIQGIAAARDSAAYTSVKHGLIGFTRSVAYDYGAHNIRANAICPGAIATAIAPSPDEESYKYQVAMSVLQRTGKPEEIAYAALFLASAESSFVTGATLIVDGGWTLR